VLAVSSPRDGSEATAPLLAAGRGVLDGMRTARVQRIVVGGAGRLQVAPGTRLVDSPDFPEAYKPEALAQTALLELVRAEGRRPAVDLCVAGGHHRTRPAHRDVPHRWRPAAHRPAGASAISAEDYAVAIVAADAKTRLLSQSVTSRPVVRVRADIVLS
jgi:putative NADH-flavin reductase